MPPELMRHDVSNVQPRGWIFFTSTMETGSSQHISSHFGTSYSVTGIFAGDGARVRDRQTDENVILVIYSNIVIYSTYIYTISAAVQACHIY